MPVLPKIFRYEIEDTRYKIQDIPVLNDKLKFEEFNHAAHQGPLV